VTLSDNSAQGGQGAGGDGGSGGAGLGSGSSASGGGSTGGGHGGHGGGHFGGGHFGGGHFGGGHFGGGHFGGSAGVGGAVFSDGGTLAITDSTLAGNTASGGTNGEGLGGAVFDRDGTLTITNSTLSGNTADGGRQVYAEGDGDHSGGDPITASAVTVTLNNSILAQSDTTVTDLVVDAINSGTETSGGTNNLIRTSTGFSGTGTITTDPLLGALADNGGPTRTMALQTGSPALDTGSNTVVPSELTTDQRGAGFARIVDGTVDIGAYEEQVATTMRVTPSSTALMYGQALSFAATVSSPGPTPVGSVSFYLDGSTTPFDVEPVNDSGQAVSQSISTLSAAGHTVSAVFSPSGFFTGSNSSANFSINPAAITITANDQSAIYGTNDPTLSAGYTLTGSLAPGDAITSVALSTGDSVGAAGNFNPTPGAAITPGSATGTGGFNATNYRITYQTGTLTVIRLSYLNPALGDQSAALLGLSPQQQFIQSLYLDELGRSGSVAELNGYLGALNGPSGREVVARIIADSSEGRDNLVRGWYQTYLGRSAVGGEELGWVYELLAGATEEAVLGGILGSTEFFQRAQTLVQNGSPQERFVQELYAGLLNRTPNPGEIASHITASSVGATSAQVAMDFLLGPEFRGDLVGQYFDTLLHRRATAQEINGWVASGLAANTLRNQIEFAPEFSAHG
jgi:hypothetical protein